MATNLKLAQIPKFKSNSLNCSFSSEDINLSHSLEFKISEFPNISISINSSSDDSEKVEYIKRKNLEILKAVKGKLSELKKNSIQAYEPLSGECTQNYEKFRSVNCYSAYPQTLEANLVQNNLLGANKNSSSKLHEIRSSLQLLRKDLRQGLESIKKISMENEEFNKKLEEIQCNIEESEAEEKSHNIGCKCEVY